MYDLDNYLREQHQPRCDADASVSRIALSSHSRANKTVQLYGYSIGVILF